MPAHPNWKPNPVFAKGETIIAVGVSGYEYQLTEGKEYVCLHGTEKGIFAGRPYVTVIGDRGREVSCHATRFAINCTESKTI